MYVIFIFFSAKQMSSKLTSFCWCLLFLFLNCVSFKHIVSLHKYFSALVAVFGYLRRIEDFQRKSDREDYLTSGFNFSAVILFHPIFKSCTIFKFMSLFSCYWKSNSLLCIITILKRTE